MTDAAILDAENTLAERRRQRGAAILDGGKPDHAGVAEAEAALDAQREAERVAAERQRQLAAEQEAERRENLRAQFEGARADYLHAIGRAEKGCREMVAAMRVAFDKAHTMKAAAGVMPVNLGLEVGAPEIARRLSYRLSILLKNIVHPARFGSLELVVGPFPQDGDWQKAEAAEMPTLTTKGRLE